MSKSTEKLFIEINDIFNDYINNDSEVVNKNINLYLEKLQTIEGNNNLVEFYKLYISTFLYLEKEDFKTVYNNCKKCITYYYSFTHTIKKHFKHEFIFTKFYKLMLDDYFNINKEIFTELEILKKDILRIEKKDLIINEILKNINIYLLMFKEESDNDIFVENLVDNVDLNAYNFLIEMFASSIFSNKKQHSKTISHYTSVSNSFNILENKKLWVSRYDFLNDKSELINILDILNSIIIDLNYNKIKEFNSVESEFMKNQLSIVYKIIAYMHNEVTELDDYETKIYNTINRNYFVLSFSENKDSLTMWGNYTKFNGCSLTFNREKFIGNFNKKHKLSVLKYIIKPKKDIIYEGELFSTFYYGKVLYNKLKVKEEIIKEFRKCLNLHKLYPSIIKEYVLNRILIELALIRGIFSKINYFAYESEYRIVFSLYNDLYKNKVLFRSKDENYVPYIKMPIEFDGLEEVIVAPKNNSDLALKGFKEYFLSKKLKIKVKKSIIPLR